MRFIKQIYDAIIRHPVVHFFLWVMPVGLIGVAAAILGGKPIPDWLKQNRCPPLKYCVLGYYVLALFATVIITWKFGPDREQVNEIRRIYHTLPVEQRRMLRLMMPLMRVAPQTLNVGQLDALAALQARALLGRDATTGTYYVHGDYKEALKTVLNSEPHE